MSSDPIVPPPPSMPPPSMPPPPPAEPAAEAPAAAVAADLPAKVSGLGCPSCGGALEVDVGVRVVVCPFCSTTLLATSELGTRRFAVEPAVDADAARQAVRAWLGSGWNKDRRLPRDAELAEAFLCFLPFFRVEADAVGVALGTEQRTRTVGSGKHRRTETYEVDVERTAEEHLDETYAALNVAEWGVSRVDLAGDRLVPFDSEELARRGMVFPPTRSEPQVRRAALAAFRKRADPGRGLHRVRFRFLETVREAFHLVYYPLWVVRYRFRERSYQALVDAQDGGLSYGKAPGNDLYRALALVASEAAVCFAATTLVQSSDDGCGAVAAALILGSAVIAWGWRRFRYGGVVEEGSGYRPAESDASSAAAVLRRAAFSGRLPTELARLAARRRR